MFKHLGEEFFFQILSNSFIFKITGLKLVLLAIALSVLYLEQKFHNKICLLKLYLRVFLGLPSVRPMQIGFQFFFSRN